MRKKLTAVLGSCIGYPHEIASRRQPATHRIRRHFIVPYHLPSRQIIHTLALPGFYTAIAHYTLRYGVKATFPALFEVFDYVDGGLGSIPCLRIRTDKYRYFCLPKKCVLVRLTSADFLIFVHNIKLTAFPFG